MSNQNHKVMNHFQKTTKKNERMRFVYFQLGLLISFSLTFLAFEWTTYYSVKELPGTHVIENDDIELPPIFVVEKPQPKVKIELTPRKNMDEILIVDKPIEKTTEEPIEEDPVVETKFNKKWVKVEEFDDDEINPIYSVDEMPVFVGGDKALFEYLANNIKYPKRDMQIGNEGKVFVEFVVGKNGEITDVKILRGVSESIDAEAVRVIKAMPNWLPGKQKGRAVKVRYKMPISFKLIK
jgi:periplasmic protein TonB